MNLVFISMLMLKKEFVEFIEKRLDYFDEEMNDAFFKINYWKNYMNI